MLAFPAQEGRPPLHFQPGPQFSNYQEVKYNGRGEKKNDYLALMPWRKKRYYYLNENKFNDLKKLKKEKGKKKTQNRKQTKTSWNPGSYQGSKVKVFQT